MKNNVLVQLLYPFLHISSITEVQILKIELAESCFNIELNHIKIHVHVQSNIIESFISYSTHF